MIEAIIYFILGFIVCYYIWNKYYAKEYKEAKAEGEVEEGAAVMLLLILTVSILKLFGISTKNL